MVELRKRNGLEKTVTRKEKLVRKQIFRNLQDVKLGGEDYKSLMCRISWRLSLVEAADRTVDEKTDDKTYEDELVDDLKGLSTK